MLLPFCLDDELAAGTLGGGVEVGLKLSFCCSVQLTANASICVRLHESSTKVRIGVGLELSADAVAWLLSASCLKRKTPPPPLQATAYTNFNPRFCIRSMTAWLGRMIPVPASKDEFDEGRMSDGAACGGGFGG